MQVVNDETDDPVRCICLMVSLTEGAAASYLSATKRCVLYRLQELETLRQIGIDQFSSVLRRTSRRNVDVQPFRKEKLIFAA